MTRSEFGILVKGMKAVYTDIKFLPDKDAFDVWYGLLKDLDYPMASKALQRYMMTSDFPPKPADIRREYATLTQPPQLDSLAAWDLVSQAMRNSAYNSQAEFAALPVMVQRAVGSANQLRSWAIDEHFNEGVTRSNFIRAYEAVCERERTEATVPESVRQIVHVTAAKLTAEP